MELTVGLLERLNVDAWLGALHPSQPWRPPLNRVQSDRGRTYTEIPSVTSVFTEFWSHFRHGSRPVEFHSLETVRTGYWHRWRKSLYRSGTNPTASTLPNPRG